MNDQTKFAIRSMVTDLVKNQLLVKSAADTYTLVKPIWSYQGEIQFQSEQDAIDKLTAAAVNHYSSQTGLRQAV